MDINSLVERTPPATSPGARSNASNASNTSRASSSSRQRQETNGSARSLTAASTPAPSFRYPSELPQQLPPPQNLPPITSHALYPIQHYVPPPNAGPYPPMNGYPPSYHPMAMGPNSRGPPPPMAMAPAPGYGHKRLASPHADTPPKKKQSKWLPEEDAAIIELRGNGKKWDDISEYLPGRSAIACRLRFQNYLERRSEWSDEKKDKLARLYERFKKDMWEKISKEMAIPWRSAEAMHWQLGEVEMAARANATVFHLANQNQHAPSQNGSIMRNRTASVSPGASYTHTHKHSLPQMSQQCISPVQARVRRNSANPPPGGPSPLRRRADSARSVPTVAASSSSRGNMLPSVEDVVGRGVEGRYVLPPVLAASEMRR